MLTGLGIGNFKAFADVQRIPIRPLTLIFGANSSGKSSIIHGLLLAHHAVETGDWDVHQPRLGAESVDLGGFPHYVHRHHATGECYLHLESDISRLNLSAIVAGREEERKPFTELRSFGMSLVVAKKNGIENQPGTEGALAIQKLRISIDGRAALEFTRTGTGSFLCDHLDVEHPFIRRLLEEMPEFGRKCDREQEERRRRPLPTLSEFFLDESPCDAKTTRTQITDIPEATVLKEQPVSRAAPADLAKEAAELGEKLREVLAERQFRLRQFRLVDDGPDEEWNYAGWREQLEEGVVLDFFGQYGPGEDEQWAQAQAIRYNLTRLIAVLTARTCTDLGRLAYLGPQRAVPPRHLVALAHANPAASGSGLEAWRRLCGDVCAQETVNRWFGASWLQVPYRLSVRRLVYANEPSVDAGIPDMTFADSSTGIRLSHRDLGFGVTQALPVLVNAAALTNSIIAIEQPELHLHPAQQAELGDVFLESALGQRKNTFLLETHSEHLILRLLRRVRETTEGTLPPGKPGVRPEQISVVFVRSTPRGSEAIELPVTPDGDFGRPWPGGFFAERFQELP